jgi:Type VI secretion system/phage-baseplate injector OB domain
MQQFFGKYRGKITSSRDPLNLGRVQVSVPAIFEEGKQGWAMPCSPYAGKGIGLFMVPPEGTNVWVEFEGGDADRPIWSGCFWGESELPREARVTDPDETIVFKAFATGGNGITMTMSSSGSAKGMTLKVESPVVSLPLKLVFDSTGIEISAGSLGKIKASPSSVKINDNALEVT